MTSSPLPDPLHQSVATAGRGRHVAGPADREGAVIGLDLGGTKTLGVRLGPDGAVLATATVPTPAREGGEAMLVALAALAREVAGGDPIRFCGVGAAGVIEDGVVVAASETFVGWTGFPLRRRLSEALGCPVEAENDVNAFAMGELVHGALRGQSDAAAVMLGTGVGGAILVGGRVFRGLGGAGEIGHIPGFGSERCTCGRHGHLETLASGPSIARRYHALSAAGGPLVPTAEVAARADAGDPVAASVFEDAARGVAQVALMLAGVLDITDVVVGGGVVRSWHLLEPGITRHLTEEPPVSNRPLRIHRATAGPEAVARGAGSLGQRG